MVGGSMSKATSQPAKAPGPKKRIFLSYGRDEHVHDALRIRDDLLKRKHEVWFDQTRLHEGRDWEAEIERGLRDCDVMVLLMTPHSVRRRDRRDPNSCDGYCLNEIAAALLRNKLIIPVLLVGLEPDGPPTSICRIQYLDLRDAVPIAEREAVYRVRLDRLVRAIELEDLDFEGGQARLIRLLKPLSFEEEIGRHIARFHGRDWLFEEIDKWLYGDPESRVFWLTGKPGVGKTAIAARLCHTRREILAYHLCKATDDDKSNPARAVLSIAYQIAQHLPEYERALQSLELETEWVKNALTLFHNLILRPLRTSSPQPDGPRIVIIDAIDEATRNGRNEIAALIADSWEDMPAWLRLIITSRPEEVEVAAALSRLRPHHLDAQSEENMHDLGDYLGRELDRVSIPAGARIVGEILDRSEGLFLYIEMVLEGLRTGDLSIDRIEEFPVGLGGHYERFFKRQFPNHSAYERNIRPMLEVICAQREPLPVPVLKRALRTPATLLPRLGKLGSLFPHAPRHASADDQTVTPFHKSIRDWLTSGLNPYAIDLGDGESRLAKAARDWEGVGPGPAQRYFLRHGVAHLVNVDQFVKATELIYRLLHQLPDGIALEHLHAAGLYLCSGLTRCPPDQARALPTEKLVDITVECGGIDHYAMLPPFRILYSHHRPAWPRIRQRILGSGYWSAMYAVSLVLAEEHAKQGRGSVLPEIAELVASTDMDEQELGLYAFKLLEGDSEMLVESARTFAGSRGFLVPALLNEFFLTQALIGEDVCEIIRSDGLWNTRWPYHRTQLDDIAAVQELVRKSQTPFSAEPGVARAREELAATLESRDRLLASPAIEAEPVLRDLLRNYERLPRKLGSLPAVAQPLRRNALMDQLLLLLFAHPAWEVRAGASTIAEAIAGGHPEVALLIARWIDHPDYRVRYSAIETAYRIRHQDDTGLFERAVHGHASDEQAWVRGIVADCLAEWVVREGKRDHAQRLERFKVEVKQLLHDTDMWPLESMVYVVRQLREEGVNVLASLSEPVGGLLAHVPGWDTLERSRLQPALDALLRPAEEG